MYVSSNFQFHGFLYSKATNVVLEKVTTQYCLSVMIEKWKNAVEKIIYFEALPADSYKVIQLSFSRTAGRRIARLWFGPTGTRTRSKLPIRRIVLGRKFYLEYHKDPFFPLVISYFSVWLVLDNERNWLCKLCRWQFILYFGKIA